MKYLVYCEYNGGDSDRTLFPTLKAARAFAEQEVGPESDSETVYIERVGDDVNDDNRYDVEIGCDTLGHYERPAVETPADPRATEPCYTCERVNCDCTDCDCSACEYRLLNALRDDTVYSDCSCQPTNCRHLR